MHTEINPYCTQILGELHQLWAQSERPIQPVAIRHVPGLVGITPRDVAQLEEVLAAHRCLY